MGKTPTLASILTKAASDLLAGLASGKYDAQVAEVEKWVATIPGPGVDIERAMEIFLWTNKATAPLGKIVPDGQGGWVPESNSRYDPKTGEFI